MRRTADEAFLALRSALNTWAAGDARPDVRVFVYPPEWEASMLARFPQFAEELAVVGCPVELADVGACFLQEVERRKDAVEMLAAVEHQGRRDLLHDLGELAKRALIRQLRAPLTPPATCRILINTGSLATFVSYSAILNGLYNETPVPSVLAFPGEGDEHSLNLLGLREDTNYRVPRI